MFLKLANNAESTLNGAIDSSQTTILVVDGSPFPGEFPYILTIWDSVVYPNPGDDSGMELVLVTGKAGNSLTVVREYGGTGISSHEIGSRIALLLTKEYFKDSVYGSETNILAHTSNASIHMLPSEKTKLSSIEAGANNYVLPVASPDIVGGIMVGNGLLIEDGILRTVIDDSIGDMKKEVYDTNNNGKVDVAEVAESVHWSNIESTPASFTPSLHSSSHTTGADKIPVATTILDGLMSKEDKTKLDGIVTEEGPGGELTPEELLTAIKTVDGAGSGLDSDLLDGLDSTHFAISSHNHSGVYEPIIVVKNTAFNKSFGNTIGTVCEGNDYRLADARTPTSHGNEAHSSTFVTQTEIDNAISEIVVDLTTDGLKEKLMVEDDDFIVIESTRDGGQRMKVRIGNILRM